MRAQVGAKVPLLHLMDREGDEYGLLAQLVAKHERFVVRQRSPRRISEEGKPSPQNKAALKTSDALRESPQVCTLEVPLTARAAPTQPKR